MDTKKNISDESHFWDNVDIDLVRKVAWASIRYFSETAACELFNGVDQTDFLLNLMGESDNRNGLILGCGDMVGEHAFFVNPRIIFERVDCYDISQESLKKAEKLCKEKNIKANYYIENINEVKLKANYYDFIVVSQAFHHFYEIDYITKEINKALKENGIFFLIEYIGGNFLQYTYKQLEYANNYLMMLPEKYRKERDGNIRKEVKSVNKDLLSPFEAVQSELIVPFLKKNMNVINEYSYAGILYPIFEGIAFNFNENDEKDLAIIKLFFELDKLLCKGKIIESSFTYMIMRKKY